MRAQQPSLRILQLKNSLGWGIHKGFQLSYTISITESDNIYSNNEMGDVSP